MRKLWLQFEITAKHVVMWLYTVYPSDGVDFPPLSFEI